METNRLLQPGRGVVGQRLGGHGRPQVRPADPDVDHGADALPRGADPRPVADAVGQIAHAAQHGVHVGHDVLPVDDEGLVFGHAQRHMEHGAVLRGVDVRTREHGVAPRLDAGRPGQVEQEGQRLVGDPVLGVVQDQVAPAGRQTRRPGGVAGEELAQMEVADLVDVCGEGGPLGGTGGIHRLSVGPPAGPGMLQEA